jgi:O-antigen/teichoic acid export membrane protein
MTARALGASGKGEVAIVQAMVGTIAFVCTLSVDQAYVFMASKKDAPRLMGRAVRDGFVAGTMIGGLIAITATLLDGRLPGGPSLYVLTSLSVPFSTSGLFALSVLQGGKEFRMWNVLRFLNASGYLLALIFAIVVSELTPTRVIQCYVAATACFWLTIVYAVRHELLSATLANGEKQTSESRVTRDLLHYGSRTHISALQSMLNQQVDISIMAFFTTTAVVGRYSLAVSVVGPLAMIGPAVAAYLFPKIAGRTGAASIGTILKLVAIVAVVAGFLWAIVSPMLIGPIFGTSFGGLGVTIALLCSAMVPLSLSFVLFAWWKGQNRPQRAAWAEGAALLIILLLLPGLVSRYGAAGAAGVSLGSYSVSCLVVYAMYRRAIGQGLRATGAPRT